MTTIPRTVIRFLEQRGAAYEVVRHPHTDRSLQTVHSAAVDPGRFAKGVLLYDAEGYYLAVLPASLRLDVKVLEEEFGRRPTLVAEDELERVFPDCERGAVPALGPAYGLDCVVDRSLREQPEVFVEAGDHRDVLRLDGPTFVGLMGDAWYGAIGRPDDPE